MPPKRTRSTTQPPTKKAKDVAPPKKRSRRGTKTAPESSGSVDIPPATIDQLVSRVADEVTKRLAGQAPSGSSAPNVSDEISEVTLGPGESLAASAAKEVLDGAVADTQQHLSGDIIVQNVASTHLPSRMFASASLPVDARVSAKLRAKILSHEFVDFGALLTNPAMDNKYQIVVQNKSSGQIPSLALEPVAKSKKILTIESWLSSFLIYVGVYTSKFPSEAPALMKYGETIQDLAARGHDWHFYDENFRYLRQNHVSSFPWGNIHWELWFRSQKSPATKSLLSLNSATKSRFADSSMVPKGYCFKFHKGGDCAGCAFKHSCYKCEGSHRADRCTFRAPAKQLFKRTQPAKAQPPHPSKV